MVSSFFIVALFVVSPIKQSNPFSWFRKLCTGFKISFFVLNIFVMV